MSRGFETGPICIISGFSFLLYCAWAGVYACAIRIGRHLLMTWHAADFGWMSSAVTIARIILCLSDLEYLNSRKIVNNNVYKISKQCEHIDLMFFFCFLKGYWLGRMPVFIKHIELNQYMFEITFFRWSLSTYKLW